MAESTYRGRRAHAIENDALRVTVLVEGGHLAEVLHKKTGVNPLWAPPWPTMEHDAYDPKTHPEYGGNSESRLLAGVMGHLVCLDTFGPPSAEETAAGMPFHGEAAVIPHEVESVGRREIRQRVLCPQASLEMTRTLRLEDESLHVRVGLRNTSALDRPIAWTEHATLGPPFLESGSTQFRAPIARSRTEDERDFAWPFYPAPGPQAAGPEAGGPETGRGKDLRVFGAEKPTYSFSANLIDPALEQGWFLAWSPRHRLLLGYRWPRRDFPWLGVWEEDRATEEPPWNGRTQARGMEFGVSPMSESRRAMIDRGSLFGVPSFRWLPALSTVDTEFTVFATEAARMPESPPS